MEAEDVVVVDIMINQQEVKVKKKEDIRSDRRNVEATQTKKTKRENKMIEIIQDRKFCINAIQHKLFIYEEFVCSLVKFLHAYLRILQSIQISKSSKRRPKATAIYNFMFTIHLPGKDCEHSIETYLDLI